MFNNKLLCFETSVSIACEAGKASRKTVTHVNACVPGSWKFVTHFDEMASEKISTDSDQVDT